MRILYFADIRFPLERANGIQTMETCYALTERGHVVHLVVKPDTQSPPRDPFAFYGLPMTKRLLIERANAPSGAGLLARVGYMSFTFGRAFGKGRADVAESDEGNGHGHRPCASTTSRAAAVPAIEVLRAHQNPELRERPACILAALQPRGSPCPGCASQDVRGPSR